jgi:hypothetical protein
MYVITLILLVAVVALAFAIKVPVMIISFEAFGFLKKAFKEQRRDREK